jgi:ketosteroid isomerase-like protein
MSQENVDVVRRMLAAFKAEPQRAWREFFAPDAVHDMSTVAGWPDRAEYRGFDEFLEFLAGWTEPYDDWSYELEMAVDAGGDEVVATLYQHGKLRGSDSWADLHYGIVYTVESGLISRAQVYTSAEEALEAARLRE